MTATHGRPYISVIIPIRNAEETIEEQLEALAGQTYSEPWELVIADNGSSDESRMIVQHWRNRLPHLRLIDGSERPGPAAARNMAARVARGEVLAFCDGDDVVAADWLHVLAEAMKRSDFVTGSIETGSNPGSHATRIEACTDQLPYKLGFRPFAITANMAVTRRAFDAVGGFDEQFSSAAGEDVDLSWRLQLVGYDLLFEPRAVIAHRERGNGRQLWRQQVAYGVCKPLLYRKFRQYGVPSASAVIAGKAYLKLILDLPKLLNREHRMRWIVQAGQRWGRLVGSIRYRTLYL